MIEQVKILKNETGLDLLLCCSIPEAIAPPPMKFPPGDSILFIGQFKEETIVIRLDDKKD